MSNRLAVCVLTMVIGIPAFARSEQGDCGQPVSDGPNPSASDCLFILGVAVGSGICEPECICDTSGDGNTSATDALICLGKAVGQAISLDCACDVVTTTTTTTATTTTTTPGAAVLKHVLPKATGRFNYDLTIGLPGADSRCNSEFAGARACRFTDLLRAETAGDLVGLRDGSASLVTAFWAIDLDRPDDDQCTVTIPWDYATAHTGQFADVVSLDNAAGSLGSVETALCAVTNWVGCCVD